MSGMKNAGDDFIDDIEIIPATVDEIPQLYDVKTDILSLCRQGAACACAAGGSHILCFAVPAVTGVFGAAASGAMYIISPVLAVGATYLVDRSLGVKRTPRSWAISTATSAATALALTFAIQTAFPHDHLNSERARYFASLPEDMQAEFLRYPQARFDRLSEDLQERVKRAAAEDGITPAQYLYICDGSDELGLEISAYEAKLPENRPPGLER